MSLDHRRTHNLLLISRLLSLRDSTSPFTLILDTLSQSSRPLVSEYILRATSQKIPILFISFNSFSPPGVAGAGGLTVIRAHRLPISALQTQITTHLSSLPSKRCLLIIDSLNPLCSSSPSSLAPFLSSLISPTTTLIATFSLDIPLSMPPEASGSAYPDSAPSPLVLLKYFATTILEVRSITHMLEGKKARDRSLVEPGWGLEEGKEGAVVGLGATPREGTVVVMEYRRKSGRGVTEGFFLPAGAGFKETLLPGGIREKVILLEDHPEWRVSEQVKERGNGFEDEEGPKSTFSLGLTEEQRKKRDEVVLPYFDAQREGGIGGGGAILFTPDREIDDFDDEEDEI
ncbi:Elongator complex protein 5 [Pyronema domesticum]|uniref:Elongator complex protein 5 n=1 Tax=Pyronema omphalodes (strain CBS 100304) TaxID=1076935 RepID=U4KXH5_PYROM|nr:Elongator complex protein 5 [Pyronema domesticum]CCX04244.1 Similar to Elongator complex protein 5; acc. no. O94495 [Pyronema omphalodes CBS 100304]